MEWVEDRVLVSSHCTASVGNTRVTDLTFVNGAFILAKSMEVLVMIFDPLHEVIKPLEGFMFPRLTPRLVYFEA